MSESIRNEYAKYGVDNFYKTIGNNYVNPHEKKIVYLLNQLNLKGSKVLDLSAGTGLVSNNILARQIVGSEPYLREEYIKNTGNFCYDFDFDDIALGKLSEHFDTIICSFALHLCPISKLPNVLFELSLITDKLVILTPNKRPTIKLFFDKISEIEYERVRMRIYKSSTTTH